MNKRVRLRELKRKYGSTSSSPIQYSFSPKNLYTSESSSIILPKFNEYSTVQNSSVRINNYTSRAKPNKRLALKLGTLNGSGSLKHLILQHSNSGIRDDKSTSSGLNNSGIKKYGKTKVLSSLVNFKSFSNVLNLKALPGNKNKKKIYNGEFSKFNDSSTTIVNSTLVKRNIRSVLPSLIQSTKNLDAQPSQEKKQEEKKEEPQNEKEKEKEKEKEEEKSTEKNDQSEVIRKEYLTKIKTFLKKKLSSKSNTPTQRIVEMNCSNRQLTELNSELAEIESGLLDDCVEDDKNICTIMSKTDLVQYISTYVLESPPPYFLPLQCLLYIMKKYFDCYSELISNITGEKEVHYSNDVLMDNYDLVDKLKDEKKEKTNTKIEEKFDPFNQNYVDHFIYTENRNIEPKEDFTIQELGEASSEHSISKKKTIRKRNSMKFGKGFTPTSGPVTNLKHIMTSKKVNEFSFVKNKNLFLRMEDKQHRFYKAFFKNKKFSLVGKGLGLKQKASLKSELLVKTVYESLHSYLLKNAENEFISTFKEFFNMLDIEKKDESGNTFLILAAKNNSIKIINFLLANGCNVNQQNIYGNTAFHYAVSFKYYEVVNLLVQYKASESLRNNRGLVPWECSNINCEE